VNGSAGIDNSSQPNTFQVVAGILLLLSSIVSLPGLVALSPNKGVVLNLFGEYKGSIKKEGLHFVNPFYSKKKVDLRAMSSESAKLKVNDKLGNPIEIAAVIVWQINDTYKALFEVSDFNEYVKNQSEAALRHLATSYPYDNIEHDDAHITLRDGGEKVIEMLEVELSERLIKAGIVILESRISHLAYSPEIAGAMLQRQQATAIVAARTKIVEGAVSMVDMALDMLSKKDIVVLDDEKKAAMVSNLMVVLCGEKSASPVVNTGTLYA
jgi:regulator of protease activity HflC (stomatin/prohibitin superfamily)